MFFFVAMWQSAKTLIRFKNVFLFLSLSFSLSLFLSLHACINTNCKLVSRFSFPFGFFCLFEILFFQFSKFVLTLVVLVLYINLYLSVSFTFTNLPFVSLIWLFCFNCYFIFIEALMNCVSACVSTKPIKKKTLLICLIFCHWKFNLQFLFIGLNWNYNFIYIDMAVWLHLLYIRRVELATASINNKTKMEHFRNLLE